MLSELHPLVTDVVEHVLEHHSTVGMLADACLLYLLHRVMKKSKPENDISQPNPVITGNRQIRRLNSKKK